MINRFPPEESTHSMLLYMSDKHVCWFEYIEGQMVLCWEAK
jgi:hypothetical protein